MKPICAAEKCTGCLACCAVCPVEAIEITEQKGFYRPQIKEEFCLDCLKCRQVCPSLQTLSHIPTEQKAFACQAKDETVRANSSSGGFFTQLAKTILARNGVVFGAAFAENLEIIHRSSQNEDELEKLRASKYVQSYIGKTFKEVKTFLQKGKEVLFSGTPCQIAGLKLYLQDTRQDKLLLVDLVCHGVPSPRLYRDYLNFQEKTYGQKIVKINFRHKPQGWKSFGIQLIFANGKEYFAKVAQDSYLVGFLKNYFLNEPCYACPYANLNRLGELTIADFWGYQSIPELPDDDKGITLVITNSKKGLTAYQETTPHLKSLEKKLSEAVASNACLREPSFKNNRYDEFWADFAKYDFAYLKVKYFMPRPK